MKFLGFLVMAIAMVFTSGCDVKGGSPCSGEDDCPTGQACVEGTCIGVEVPDGFVEEDAVVPEKDAVVFVDSGSLVDSAVSDALVAFDAAIDSDGDGVPDVVDNCDFVVNATQGNADGDLFGDACDLCPVVPGSSPGANDDVDGDGIGLACDNCGSVVNIGQENYDGDMYGDACDDDDDNDQVLDVNDSTPTLANTDVTDFDGDGVGDASDNCPEITNPLQENTDYLNWSIGELVFQYDDLGDVCDDDDDGDLVLDANDLCPLEFQPANTDIDADGIGDVCDLDIDGDTISNITDNCPGVYNLSQADTDSDGIGDECE